MMVKAIGRLNNVHSRPLLEKISRLVRSFFLFSAESLSVHLTSARAYQVINVMNGGLMTLTSTLFKGSRIKDGIWTRNNAGGAGVAGMVSLSINVIVLLIVLLMHYESPLRPSRAY